MGTITCGHPMPQHASWSLKFGDIAWGMKPSLKGQYHLLLLLFNIPLTFLHYVNNSIKTQIQSRKTRTLRVFDLYNLLLFFSYIQMLFRFFLDFISSSISTLFYYLSFCSCSQPFSARPLLELGCWVNDIGADERKIGNK